MEQETRFVFTGGRSFVKDADGILELILQETGLEDSEGWGWDVQIQHGGAEGFDTLVDEWLRGCGWDDSITIVRPDYKLYSNSVKYAPIARNYAMIDWATKASYSCVIACLHKDAPMARGGTASTINYALGSQVDAVKVYRYDDRSCA